MQSNEQKTKRFPFDIKKCILIVLVFVAVALAFSVAIEIGEPREIEDAVSNMQFDLKHGNYAEMYMHARTNRRLNYEGSDEYKKYEAVADYYMYSLEYRPLLETDEAKAKVCYENMQDAKARMKELDFAAGDIDKLFEKYD